jgi:protein-S-isoprenylcysteine O-methyltransferase Ste14
MIEKRAVYAVAIAVVVVGAGIWRYVNDPLSLSLGRFVAVCFGLYMLIGTVLKIEVSLGGGTIEPSHPLALRVFVGLIGFAMILFALFL